MKNLLMLLMAGLVVLSCSQEQRKATLVDWPTGGAEYTPGTDSLLPRLLFAGGDTSMNDRCMVRLVKLNRRLPGVLVNGHPVGFC